MDKSNLFFSSYSLDDLFNWFIKNAESCPKVKLTCLHADTHVHENYVLVHPAGWITVQSYDLTTLTWGTSNYYNNADLTTGTMTGGYFQRIYDQLFNGKLLQDVYMPTVTSLIAFVNVIDAMYEEPTVGRRHVGRSDNLNPEVYTFPSATARYQLNNPVYRGGANKPYAITRIEPDGLEALFWVNVPQIENCYRLKNKPKLNISSYIQLAQDYQAEEKDIQVKEILDQLKAGATYESLRDIYLPEYLDEAWSEFGRINATRDDGYIWASIPDVMMTQGIDNLGVYTPYYARGDAFATYYLYKNGLLAMEEGTRKFLVGDPEIEKLPAWQFATTVIPAALSRDLAVLGWSASLIPYGLGQPVNQMIRLASANFYYDVAKELFSTSTTRTILPRMYGFGRHNENGNKVASYASYIQFFNTKCPDNYLRTGNTFQSGNLEEGWIMIPLAEAQYNAFVQKIRDYAKVYQNEF